MTISELPLVSLAAVFWMSHNALLGERCVTPKKTAARETNAPINVNPVGEGGGVRARGGDLMTETIPLSGF